MKKDRINTIAIREIKSTFKRFISLLVMSLLGVCVFVGIKMVTPNMVKSLDTYYDDENVYDLRIISTLGITDDDVKSIEKIKGVKKSYGSFSKDVLIKTNNEDTAIRVIGLSKKYNKVILQRGRLPKNNNEIVVEQGVLDNEGLKLGSFIKINDDETFKETNLKIVGIVKSPLFINNANKAIGRGISDVGSGKINYYAYVNKSNFNLEYYTECYVTLDNTKNKITNSDEYKKEVDKVLTKIDKIKNSREKSRYDELYNKANNEIESKRIEGENRLSSAKYLLDSTKKELLNAKTIIEESQIQLNDANQKLVDTKSILQNKKNELDDAKKELDETKSVLDDYEKQINDELITYGVTTDDIIRYIEKINNNEITKEEMIGFIPKDLENYEIIIEWINKIYDLNLEGKLNDFILDNIDKDKIIENIPTDLPNYDEIIEAVDNFDIYYDKVLELYKAIKSLEESKEKYNESYNLYIDGKDKYNSGYITYLTNYNTYQNQLSIYNNSLRKYNSGLNMYDSKLQEYYESKRVFDKGITDAKSELNNIPKAKWYIYTRLDEAGYSSFIDNTNSISNLSKIFPTIFFVVSILISLISMSRMVEDDRTLIGTLKSLGFSNRNIRKKYVLYSSLATILGGLIGSIIGFFILPKIIWNIYKILFDIPVFSYDFNLSYMVIGISISMICICGATLLTIKNVLKEKPSILMRPKAPTDGKRIFLEKIPFIWNKFSFSNKITTRNIFRYKKRVLMTIIGISGCTALLLVGYGIRDSIIEVPNKQYKEIFNYDDIVYLTGQIDEDKLNNIFNDKNIKDKVGIKIGTLVSKGNKSSINLISPYDTDEMKKFLNINDINSNRKLELNDNEVIISDKLSTLDNLKIGDSITLVDYNNKEYSLKVTGICENYVGNYVFINKETYEKYIGDYSINMVYLNLNDLNKEKQLSKKLLEHENVLNIVSVSSTMNSLDDMLKSLNNVVLILIVLSGALSFVVFYNLAYININERKREIATLKVLGFTNKEVDNYIIKEMSILTIVGIMFGLVLGVFLTSIIIDTIEIDMVKFLHKIKFSSYIMTTLLIILFTLIVNFVIHFTLKKIDMIESLKSVE